MKRRQIPEEMAGLRSYAEKCGAVFTDRIGCPMDGCRAEVDRIERYGTTVSWGRVKGVGAWSCGASDEGSHFHLYCTEGHEVKRWGRELPAAARRVVFPGND